jgi:hypothetical protein
MGRTSDQFPPCQTIIPTAFRSQSGWPTNQILGHETERGCRQVSSLETSSFETLFRKTAGRKVGGFNTRTKGPD